MKRLVAILFEIMPFISSLLILFFQYQYGYSSDKYCLFLVILFVPAMIHLGMFGNNLKRKYDDFFDYDNHIPHR